MKIADVKIGETYRTMVSGTLVRVVVTHRVEPSGWNKTARFKVQRVDNGRVLDSRAASALRPLPPKPKASVLHYADPSGETCSLTTVQPDTEDLAAAKAAYIATRSKLAAGELTGYVRLLLNGQPHWRFPPLPKPGNAPTDGETAK